MRADDNNLPVMNTSEISQIPKAAYIKSGALLYDRQREVVEYFTGASGGHVLKTLGCDHIYRTDLREYTILDDALAFCGKSTYALMRFICVDGGGIFKGSYKVREDGFGVGPEIFFERRGSYYYRSNGNPRRFIAQVWGLCDHIPSHDFLEQWYKNTVDDHSDDDLPF